MFNSSYIGKQKRMNKIFDCNNKKTLIVPVDDSLIFGPFGGLKNLDETIHKIIIQSPNALLGFKGLFRSTELGDIPIILNVTGSTTMGNHVHKVPIYTAKEALILGADCIAVHVNYTSQYENEMIKNLATFISEADSYGMPVLAISYPRKEKSNLDYNYEDLKEANIKEYTDIVCHCVRTSAELGADIIKTQYTGSTESFKKVVESAMGLPVVIAGGPVVSVKESYSMAKSAIDAGASGISFGRNVFNSTKIEPYIDGLKAVVFENFSVDDAIKLYESKIIK